MEDNSKKLMIEVFKLASMFCAEASELISGYARREEILRRDPVNKGVKIGENDRKERTEKKNEKVEKKVEKGKEKQEKGEKKVEKNERAEKNEKAEKEEVKKKSSKKHRKDTGKQKSGYHLFLKSKMQEIRAKPGLETMQIGDISSLVSKQWENLDSTEREIWDEKSKEDTTEKTRVIEIIPQKTSRSEEPEKSKKSKKKPKTPSSGSGTDSESEPSENLKKKKKTSE
ncbi:hypothetical protein SteCoe_9190 [Stentor coeruleus]|uniref:HMG box domain-containing protein n=1 Tax=Stentor coeruleus TaxID=5963 RepID=A0A1R2CIH9_9CILI|nr:hypothetical protein SteCoe_9190 [Stentor coeruleus]